MRVPSSLRESESLFAERVVELQVCSADRVGECVAALERLATSGVSPIPSLGEMLVENGYLTPPQFGRTLKLSREIPPTAPTQTSRRHPRSLRRTDRTAAGSRRPSGSSNRSDKRVLGRPPTGPVFGCNLHQDRPFLRS